MYLPIYMYIHINHIYRVPEGASDADNALIREWGTEKRKLGEGYLWHDEIANRMNGLDVDAATRISGARFSVLKL